MPDPDLPGADSPADASSSAHRVLITRPQPGAAETARLVTELGLSAVVAPVMAVRPRRVTLPPSAAFAAVLVTSGNAIPALPRAYHRKPLLAVGQASAARGTAAGFHDVQSADGDAQALAAFVAARLRPADGVLLLATGEGQGHALTDALRAGGFRVVRRVVYAVSALARLPRPAAEALRAGNLHAALFFSAETARAFIRQVRRARLDQTLDSIEAISIGQPAAVALRELRWRRVSVAARPNQDAMLALLR